MRGILARARVLGLTVLTACAGLRDLVPEGPVLGPLARADRFGVVHPSGVAYDGRVLGAVPVPVLPIWGVRYDLDLVVRTREPGVDLHELARFATPDGPVWIHKEAAAGSLRQTLVADLPAPLDVATVLPEIRVPRRPGRVDVDDRSDDRHLDLTVHTTDPRGGDVLATFRSRTFGAPLALRNSPTMGHSRTDLLAALDLSHRRIGGRGTWTVDGARVPLVRILGLVPFRVALAQTQGGLSSADVTWTSTPEGPRAHHVLVDGATADTAWSVRTTPGGVELVQDGPWRTLRYTFVAEGDALELLAAEVVPAVGGPAAASLRLDPALPDPRRPFPGVARSAWVLDVDGQASHALGDVELWWEGDTLHLRVLPEAPRWVRDRAMAGTLTWSNGTAHLDLAMTGTDAVGSR